jgi:4-hydroxythreonine-4-phosphate dehydrogenase
MSHKIIITAGDPLGIGQEVVNKALSKLSLRELPRVIVIGALAPKVKEVRFIPARSVFAKTRVNAPSKYGGDISFEAVKLAVNMILNGCAAALVSAPISKEAWFKAGVKFTGHTEFLNRFAAKEGALMTFRSGKINCALVTEHSPVENLKADLTKEKIIKKTKIFAKTIGGKTARIGIAALNPHCGDGGKLGSQEKTIITPAINALKKAGYNVNGPVSSDSLWLKHIKGEFDGIVCMYHDQALLGLKLAAKRPVLHITAGLKFLRVSPAHGTAFDIAGQNKADASGMLAAVKYALYPQGRNYAG